MTSESERQSKRQAFELGRAAYREYSRGYLETARKKGLSEKALLKFCSQNSRLPTCEEAEVLIGANK